MINEEWPNKQHASHKSVRPSDASIFDFICDDCGATDSVTGGWAGLRKPCKQNTSEVKLNAGRESVALDKDGYTIWNGNADRPVSKDTIVFVKVRSGVPRDPVSAGAWPQICWRHREKEDQWDIVAYKVLK